MPDYSDPAQAHQNLISDLSDSYRNVRMQLHDLELVDVDPRGVTINEGTRSGKVVRRLHAGILDYREFFTPLDDRDEWVDELYNVDRMGLDETITLSNLGAWRQRYRTVEQSVNDPVSGQAVQTQKVRIWIPPSAAVKCFNQLNNMRQDYNIYFDLPEAYYSKQQEPDILTHE